ncbi:hypothetical protein MMA231_04000 (plasmid) [Asticcacaulis sp. MM231]|uniref:M13 family metallopeptidase n=1 Tax=Asticcacaulis sp. MM231 TaxID=3157666 RepID=UPI0032D57931
MLRAKFNLAVLSALAVPALAQPVGAEPSICPPSVAMSGAFAPQGIDTSTFNRTLHPGDDFFAYANDGWVKATPIPSDHWDYGQTDILGATVDAQIKTVIVESVTHPGAHGTPSRQVADAYASFLDSDGIKRTGLASVRPELTQILSSRTPDEVARWMADPTSSSLFAINLFPADGQWRVHLDQQNLSQPMLGLNRDDYGREDAAKTRTAYQAYIEELFEKAGVDAAAVRAVRVVALETAIAANQWEFNRLRDRRANYHPMTVEDLTRYAPGFPWRAFLKARGVGKVKDIVLGTDTAVQAQARLFTATPLDDWKSYLAFHWLQNQIDVLPAAFRQASWTFYGQTLSNAKSPPSREEVASRLVNTSLGPLIGRLYADRYVSPKTRTAAQGMIDYLRTAFDERLVNVTWMDDATRKEARAKLAHVSFKVGYPTLWRDYSRVDIRRGDAAGNLRRIRQADWAHQVRRLNPNIKDEPWYQTPQTVDASYSVLYNAIELPGAYLQAPYFDADADPAANFGAIGAIIGHELGHGFDDQGIIYDGEGRMRDWWSKDALEQFYTRTEALVDQYSAFTPYPGLHLDGQKTIGENIADLSGVSLAYRAYHMYLQDHPCVGRVSMDGLTGDQRFFLAWAQVWRYQAPESAIRWLIKYNPHAPAQYRVNGVVQNLDAWYAAFDVKPSDALYLPPEKRVRIW